MCPQGSGKEINQIYSKDYLGMCDTYISISIQVFSKTIKSSQKKKPTKFEIDLRSPEEMEEDLKNELDTEC